MCMRSEYNPLSLNCNRRSGIFKVMPRTPPRPRVGGAQASAESHFEPISTHQIDVRVIVIMLNRAYLCGFQRFPLRDSPGYYAKRPYWAVPDSTVSHFNRFIEADASYMRVHHSERQQQGTRTFSHLLIDEKTLRSDRSLCGSRSRQALYRLCRLVAEDGL